MQKSPVTTMKPLSESKGPLTRRDVWVFIIPSLIGVLLFLFPIKTSTGVSIPIAVMAQTLSQLLASHIHSLVFGIICLSGLLTFMATLLKPDFVCRHLWLKSLLLPGTGWLIIRTTGVLFAACCFFSMGFESVYNPLTGSLVFNDLLPTLFCVFIFAGLFLPLLLDFGLLEFLGTLASKVMRPFFNLPGRSAVDCCTSWLGDGSVGILLTAKQFEQGFYTHREAAIIATNFSAVSITFSLIILTQVNLQQHFVTFYLCVCLCGLACAIILPRLPPLSRKPNTYIDGTQAEIPGPQNPSDSLLKTGFHQAVVKASQVAPIKQQIIQSLQTVVEMLFGLLPVVMAIGTLSLMVAEYTSVFAFVGKPFVPLLDLLGIDQATEAASTLMVGFADMFVPAILSSGIESPATRFFVAVLSVTQLIYLSEVGALIMGSKIPINFFELFIIFMLRTLVSIPIIALVCHMYF